MDIEAKADEDAAPPVVGSETKYILLNKLEVQGFDFSWISSAGNRQKVDLKTGMHIHVKGHGPGLTVIKPFIPSDNATIQVGNVQNAMLTLEGMTIHCGRRAAIHAGLEKAGFQGSLHLRLIDCEIIADEPDSGYGHTSLWGIFAYNCRVTLERVRFNCKHLAEHALYLHNGIGAYIHDCEIVGTGSEGFKFTCRDHEGGSPPERAKIHIKNTAIYDWHQRWAWRGGAAIVVQGARMNILIEDCLISAPVGRERCIMIDDGGDDRPIDNGDPNGWLIVRRTAVTVPSGTSNTNYPPMIRIGSLMLGEDLSVVTAALFKNCGIWGQGLSLQVSKGAVPEGRLRVQGCNTKFIEGAAQARGVWVGDECMIPLHDRLKPLSEGHEA